MVGGGAAGTIAVIHLLASGDDDLVVTLFEPRSQVGGGVAYSSDNPVHRINVPAARMSVFVDDSEHFHRWALAAGIDERDPEARVGNALFPRRNWFGRYLAGLLDETASTSRARLTVVDEAVVEASRRGGGFFLRSASHAVTADAVIVATGNPAPDLPATLAPIAQDSRLIADPLADDALAMIPRGDAVLIVGSGLTMADAVASLIAQGHAGAITAVSRHGLLPRPGSTAAFEPADYFASTPPKSALGLLRKFRGLARDHDLSQIIDSARRVAPSLWAALPLVEKQRFLRYVRVFWETRRFVMAPQIAAVLDRAFVTVLAGRVVAVTPNDNGIDVVLRHRRSGRLEQWTVRWVINATGPAFPRAVAKSPLLSALNMQGLIEPDALGFGLATDRFGRAGANIFVVGPLARGAYGELSGIREISAQARSVAASICQTFQADAQASFLKAHR